MRVLLADALDAGAVTALEDMGCTVDSDPSIDADTLPSHLAGVAVLVVRSTKVTAEALDAGDQLALVVRAGAGVENIDVDAASARGIHVCNVPGKNAVAVAELTMGLLLAIDRRIPDAVSDLRAGQWRKKHYSQADGLMGRAVGIVGLGQIGLAFAERAKAFGLTVYGMRRGDRSPEVENRVRSVGIRLVETLEELVDAVDILSVHVPGGPSTQGLIGEDVLSRMAPGSILLNTSRGDVVDDVALLRALDRGVRAGLDVFPDEPKAAEAEYRSALSQHPNVVGTHHIGASTEQAQRAIAAGVVEVVRAFRLGDIQWSVNLETAPLGSCALMVRHYDRVGVLAHVLGVLRAGGLNVEQMENRIFQGSTAAIATLRVAGEVTDEIRAEIVAHDDVLGVSVVAGDR